MRGIDKKATADDLEDYFYDNFENLEDIERKTFMKGKDPKTQREVFRGSVVLTFADRASADKFMAIEFIRFRGDSLDKITMEEVIKKKEEDKKKRLDDQGGYYYFRVF